MYTNLTSFIVPFFLFLFFSLFFLFFFFSFFFSFFFFLGGGGGGATAPPAPPKWRLWNKHKAIKKHCAPDAFLFRTNRTWLRNLTLYSVASPAPKKWGGPNHVSLLVSSKSYNIHTWGTPRICEKKTFQRICANPKRGLNRSGGGSGPLHSPPWRRHWILRNLTLSKHLIWSKIMSTTKLICTYISDWTLNNVKRFQARLPVSRCHSKKTRPVYCIL